MRLALLVVLAVGASGCGTATPPRQTSGPPPGKADQRVGPPRAWLETPTVRNWLAGGSSCWHYKDHGVCADGGEPRCDQSFIPHFRVAPGETVRVHLGFTPEEASLSGESGVQEPAELHGRILRWQVAKGGVFSVFARQRRGDASYSGCLDLTN
jgi:hypothetical protein